MKAVKYSILDRSNLQRSMEYALSKGLWLWGLYFAAMGWEWDHRTYKRRGAKHACRVPGKAMQAACKCTGLEARTQDTDDE